MAAGSTYTPIATTTLGSAQASVTFSSISGSYTDIVLVINCKIDSGTSSLCLRFNNDTNTNYSFTYLYGNGTSASSGRATSTSFGLCGYSDATNFNPNITNIMNYSNSTTYKTFIDRRNTTTVLTAADVSLWRSTSAINRFDIYVENGANFASGSTFTLYGITAA